MKILSRRGVPEVLDFLSKNEPITASELVEKTSISKLTLPILRKEGLVKVSSEKTSVREISVMRKRAFYMLTEKGERMLELYTTLEDEAKELLKITTKQADCIKSLKTRKRRRDIPDNLQETLHNLVRRGLVGKEVSEEEETIRVYRMKRLYSITEKGLKIYEAYKTIESL